MKVLKSSPFPLMAGLLVLVIFGVFFFANTLVARTLGATLGIPVRVGGVHLKLMPIELGIRDVKFLNPGRFEEPAMVFMPELFIRIDPAGFFKKKIHIRQIRVHIEEVTVERNREGKINLYEWLQTLKRQQKTAGQAPAPGPAPPSGKPQERAKKSGPGPLQIDEVVLNLGMARYVDDAKRQVEAKVFALNIRNERLHDAADPVTIAQQVVEIVLKRVGLWAMSAQIDKMASQWMEQARGAMGNLFK